METTHRTIKNSVYSFLGYTWPILFSLFITPLIVRAMGIKEYGIYTFINTVISIIGLLDLGISTAVAKYLAEYHGRGDMDRIRKLLSTANTIFLGVGIVGCAVILMGTVLPHLFSAFEGYGNYSVGLFFAGFLFLVSSVSSIYSVSLNALQRFDIGFKIGSISITIQQLTILTLVLTGHSINAIFMAQFFVALATLVAQKIINKKILPGVPYQIGWDKEEAKKSYKFGVATFINGMATVSLTYLDRLILPFFLGPSSLTFYSLPGNIAMKIPGVSNSLAAVLFPIASSLSGGGEHDRLKTLYVRSFRLITVLAAALSVTTIAFAYPLLAYWITPEVANQGTLVLIILTITNFTLALTGSLSNFLLGLGKLKLLTISSYIMAGLNVILLFVLVPRWGIVGAAWAYALSLIPSVYMFYFTEKHYLNLVNRGHYYRNIILKNIAISVIILTISYYSSNLIHNFPSVLLVGACTGFLYLVLYWVCGFFESEDVESMKKFIHRIFVGTFRT